MNNINWFGEKASQVSFYEFECFGITCSSRYSKAEEVAEMIVFCKLLAERGLNRLVRSIFYDSKACVADIEFSDNYDPNEYAQTIYSIGNSSLGQFELDGYGVSGKGMMGGL